MTKVMLLNIRCAPSQTLFQRNDVSFRNLQVPALQLQSTEYEPMRWDYFVSHYKNESRQEKDSKMAWQTPSGEHYVGHDPPTGSEPLGIWYPRAGTLGGCSAHNALITIYPHER